MVPKPLAQGNSTPIFGQESNNRLGTLLLFTRSGPTWHLTVHHVERSHEGPTSGIS